MKSEIETRTKSYAHMESMYTAKVNQMQKQLDIANQKVRDTDKHLQHVRKREVAEKTELVKVKNQLAQLRRSTEDQICQLQRDNTDLTESLRQSESMHDRQLTELTQQYQELEAKFVYTRDELESLESSSATLLEKGRKYTELEVQFEMQRNQLDAAQRAVQNFESELAAYGDWKVWSKTFQTRLNKIPDLEKDLEQLRRDNKSLHDSIGQKLLLEEQVYDFQSRLERQERAQDTHVELRTLTQSLEMDLREYNILAADHCAPGHTPTAANLRARIESVLQTDLILMSEKCSGKTEKDFSAAEVTDLKRQAEVWQKSVADLQTSLKQHKNSLHRVQKKLQLVASERDCYKKLIENYEKDLTSKCVFGHWPYLG